MKLMQQEILVILFSDIIHEKHNNPKAIAVCEISSFQAELNKGILLDGFIWTNFHEDHLDTYKNKKDYFMAKLNLLDSLKVKCVFCIGEQLLEVKDKSFWDGYGASVVSRHVKFHNDLKNNSVFRSYPQSLNF